MSKSTLRGYLGSFLVCASASVLLTSGTAHGQAQPMAAEKALTPQAMPPQASIAAVTPEIRDSVLALLHVQQCDLLILPVDFTPGLPLSIGLPIDGAIRALDLHPHSVRSARFAVFEQRDDGQTYQVKAPVENSLRGEIRGDAGSAIAGGVLADGLAARIILGDGREFWIEPVSARIPGAPAGLHALYTRSDLGLDQQWRCGGPELGEDNDHEVEHAAGGDGPAVRGATLWTAVMDIDADWEYYQSYGGTGAVSDRISVITNTMNLQYERDVNISHAIGTVIVRTTAADPYTATDPAVLNTQIETEWSSANRPGTSDVVQLFTARDIDSNTIGRANHIGSICLDGDSNCLVQSDFNGNFMSATDLSAHELGHLWAGVHCSCSNPASTMNPIITSINRFTLSNDQDNVGQINAYRATRGCLTVTTPGTAASNDSCADAILIGPGVFGFSNNNATTDQAAPTNCGTGNDIQEDVWFRFVAPCNGMMEISTCGTTFDTVMLVYTGFCGSLNQVACNDDSASCGGNGLQSAISVPVTFGTSYLIRVGGYLGANGAGLFNMSMTGCPAPSNNSCAAAITIDHCAPVAFSTVGATTDGPLEQAACDFFGYQQVGSDIWFRYVAPCTGTVRVSLCGSAYDTKLAVYASCPGGPGTTLGCNDDFCGLQSQVDFAATAGADYFFRVGGFNNAQGAGTLSVTNLSCPIPSNDTCNFATPVGTGATGFSTVGACSDGFISALCANDSGDVPRDVWYLWLSPACSGQATIDTCSATFDTKLAVYTSCPSGDQTAIACNDDACGVTGLGSRVSFAATPNTYYLIRVGGFNGNTGTGTLNIAVTPPSAPANDACAAATPVTNGNSYFSTLCAATNDGTGSCGAAASNPDVWFVYTATCTGPVSFNTCGTHDGTLGQDIGVDTVLSVFSGNCGELTELGCSDDAGTCAFDSNVLRDSEVVVNVTQGNVYRIRIAEFGGHPVNGPVRLNVGACTPLFCDADWCHDGAVGVPDIFCFLSDWFAFVPAARNYGGTPGVPAIFAFLSIWFATGQGPCVP